MIKPNETGHVCNLNAQIYYEVYGEGFPLTLIHGNGPGNIRYFDKQIKFFSKYFKVVGIDRRGVGKSTFGNEKLTYSLLASDVVKVLNELGIHKSHFVGFSDGAAIIMRLALDYPERVTTLILDGITLKAEDFRFYIQIFVKIGYKIFGILSKISSTATKYREFLRLCLEQNELSIDLLKEFKFPILILLATGDYIKKKTVFKDVTDAMNIVRVPAMTHFIAERKSKKYNAAIFDFITSIEKG